MTEDREPPKPTGRRVWLPGQRDEVGAALVELTETLGDIIFDMRGDDDEPASLARAATFAGLVAGHNHLAAMAGLFHDGMGHAHSVMALARAGVESFGRAWRILSVGEEADRIALAEKLREHEEARARKNGAIFGTVSGEPFDATDADWKETRGLDQYTKTAADMMVAGGLQPSAAIQHYSMMSSVAHGEYLGVRSLVIPEEGGHFGLPKYLAGAAVRDVVGAAAVVSQAYSAIYAPGHELQIQSAIRATLQRLFVALEG